MARTTQLSVSRCLARMCDAISCEKRLALLRAEMADGENRGQVLGRDWRRIGRAGDLRHETAVLAERVGKPLASTRWTLLDDSRQHTLIGSDRGLGIHRGGGGLLGHS